MTTKNTTPKAVALFMQTLYNKEKFLLQKVAAIEISDKFGEQFVSFNTNGNLGIDKEVLAEFKKLTPNAIWDRRMKAWREKERGDPKNSRQTDYR